MPSIVMTPLPRVDLQEDGHGRLIKPRQWRARIYAKSLLAALAVVAVALAGVGGLALAQDENDDDKPGYGEGMSRGMTQGRGMGQADSRVPSKAHGG